MDRRLRGPERELGSSSSHETPVKTQGHDLAILSPCPVSPPKPCGLWRQPQSTQTAITGDCGNSPEGQHLPIVWMPHPCENDTSQGEGRAWPGQQALEPAAFCGCRSHVPLSEAHSHPLWLSSSQPSIPQASSETYHPHYIYHLLLPFMS